jgi:multisubunit Na+/H+ antiporter MnhB subunit
MIATYVLQASLVTISVLVPFISRLQWDSNLYLSSVSNWAAPLSSKRRTVCHNIHISVRESARVLLDASLLLCVTILVAATYRIGKPAFQSSEALNTFEVLTSAFVALYSICPAVAVYAIASEHLRRKKARTIVWFLVAALTILMMGFYYYSRWNPWNIDLDALTRDWDLQNDPDHQVSYEVLCSIGRNLERLLKDVEITTGFAATLAGMVLYYLTFILALDHIPGVHHFRPLQILRTHWYLISSLLALVATWTMLGLIIGARERGKRFSGETNKAHQWTFGQIISLATFLPIPIEFLYCCILGVEKALTGLMSKYYYVAGSPEPPKQTEMDRNSNGKDMEDSKIEDGGV